MQRTLFFSLLSCALCASAGFAHATETARHNDIDGDGRSDLIWRNATTGAVVSWSGADAARATTLRIDPKSFNLPPDLDLSRMDVALAFSDAFTDPARCMLYFANSSSGAIIELYPEAENLYYAAPYLDDAYGVAGAGDFDANGAADLLYRNPRTGRNMLLRDAAWGEWAGVYPVAAVVNLDWAVAGIGDFDGDGKSDILWRNQRTGQNSIWRSADIRSSVAVPGVPLAWKIAAIGDFNGDGRTDIFWRNSRTGANVLWYSGQYTTSKSLVGVTDTHWQVTATGDFDGDGKFDLFWRNSRTGANIIWRSANPGTRMAAARVSSLAWSTVM